MMILDGGEKKVWEPLFVVSRDLGYCLRSSLNIGGLECRWL